jgi:hypothetical protein
LMTNKRFWIGCKRNFLRNSYRDSFCH